LPPITPSVSITCFSVYHFVSVRPLAYLFLSLSVEACNSNHVEHNGSCYYFSTSVANNSDANQSCHDIGLYLVAIETPEEQDFVVDNLLNPDVNHWIGLTADGNGNQVWSDGTNVTYSNYGMDEVHVFDDGGLCFRIRPSKNYTWYDQICSNLYRYICERKTMCPDTSAETPTCTLYTGTTSIDPISILSSDATQTIQNMDTSASLHANTGASSATPASMSTFAPLETADGFIYDTNNTTMATPPLSSSPPSTAPRSSLSWTTEGRFTSKSYQPTSKLTVTPTTHFATSYHGKREYARSTNFRLLASNSTIIADYVHSSYSVSSHIGCAQRCLANVMCTAFAFIPTERLCLLGEMHGTSSRFERHRGATTYLMVSV
ncbi:uncharacterized protein LOC121431853, partial [Lytechinus variegatus]|uniref:uncharacterized protein LOC121431853 n=1 Tax=Lytechinus variegatus TaxID=7654 RepID=UPI001BB2B2C2